MIFSDFMHTLGLKLDEINEELQKSVHEIGWLDISDDDRLRGVYLRLRYRGSDRYDDILSIGVDKEFHKNLKFLRYCGEKPSSNYRNANLRYITLAKIVNGSEVGIRLEFTVSYTPASHIVRQIERFSLIFVWNGESFLPKDNVELPEFITKTTYQKLVGGGKYQRLGVRCGDEATSYHNKGFASGCMLDWPYIPGVPDTSPKLVTSIQVDEFNLDSGGNVTIRGKGNITGDIYPDDKIEPRSILEECLQPLLEKMGFGFGGKGNIESLTGIVPPDVKGVSPVTESSTPPSPQLLDILQKHGVNVPTFGIDGGNQSFILKDTAIKFQLERPYLRPMKAHPTDAGYDLITKESFSIPSNCGMNRYIALTGVRVALPKGTYGQISAKSGLAAKKGIDVGAGVIDQEYRGELRVLLINNGPKRVDFICGDKIAQLIILPLYNPSDEIVVNSLDETWRGENGFGSTGR